jgi:hypothetical protein
MPEQEEVDVLQSCATSQNLTAGILVVSDSINSLVQNTKHNVSQATTCKSYMGVYHICNTIISV